MTDTDTRAEARRSPFARRSTQQGPRATFRQLLPFIFEHRPVLIWVAVLSIIGALTSLAQPLLVGRVINVVEAGEPPDLYCGPVRLADGREISGILYPRALAEGRHRDISAYGDWRAYMAARQNETGG